MIRAALLCVLVSGWAGLQAQRLLVPVLRGETPPESLVLGSRITVPDVRPVQRGDASTVLVLSDLLTAEDRPALLAELRRRFVATRQKENLTVVVVRGLELAPLPPARQFPALEKELLALLDAAPEQERTQVNAGRLYDLLLGAVPAEAETWREVVWAGRLPELPAGQFRDFARARIERQLNLNRALLRVWPPDQAGWLPVQPIPPDAKLLEVSWPSEPAQTGHEIRTVSLDGVDHRYLVLAEGAALPALQEFDRLAQAVEKASRPEAGAAELSELRTAAEVYPAWPGARESGAALAEKLNDPEAAAHFLQPLSQQSPDDKALLRRYALALAFSAPAGTAEPVLKRAIEAHPDDAVLLERFGRAKLQQGDKTGAYARFRQSLRIAPANSTLWWICADLAKDLGDTAGERESLRQALQLDPARIDRRARAIRLALEAADGVEARSLLDAATSIPDETGLLAEYASFWERLAEPARALPLWQRSTKADASFEAGWLAVARLELAAERPAESLAAAEAGLTKLAKAPALHAARIQALVALGRVQEARRLLTEATAAFDDLALTRQQAEVQDLFGGSPATQAWDRYLVRGKAQRAGAAELAAARQRAVRTALRDGDPQRAAALLELPAKPPPTEARQTAPTGIPAGVQALAYLSGIAGSKDPARYMNDFARGVAQKAQLTPRPQWQDLADALLDNYTRLIQLRQLGKPVNGGAIITIVPGNKTERQRTQKVLELLGYRLRTSGGKLQVEAGVKKEQGARQNLAVALDIDEGAMEESLESGKPFEIRVNDDFAEIVLGDKAWAQFQAKYGNSLGFAGMFLREPQLARLYAGLSSAGARAAEALQNKIGLKVLAESYADLIFYYGPAMALNAKGECPAPGGTAAEAAWRQLSGVSPRQGPEFLDALVRKEDGMLLAFYAALHSVTEERQRWFLQSPARARLFFEIMRDAPEWKNGAGRRVRKSPIVDLFRTLPLTPEGEVRFPGGPQVWQVAKGAGDLDRVNKLAARAERARPAEEEALLARIAKHRYEAGNERFSQLENLLAVSQVETALGRELTPREALVLSQHFGEFEWAFPFFTALPGLSDKEFTAFFSWVENWQQDDVAEANLLLGMFENIVLLEGLLVRAGSMTGPASAEVFLSLCQTLRSAQSREAVTVAAHAALQQIGSGIGARPGAMQAAIEDRLLGPAGNAEGQRNRKNYRSVLQLQKTPELDSLLNLLSALAAAPKGPAETRAAAAAIEQVLPGLAVAPMPKGEQIDGRIKSLLQSWRTEELVKLPREMKEKAARKKPNVKDFARLAAEAQRELAPWLELSLRGIVQGFYLRPDDLPVSEDPLLLRKHQYRLTNTADRHLFPPPEFTPASQGAGSLPSGSLAGMAGLAGHIAVAGRRSSQGFAEAFESRQIGSLRNGLFWMVDEASIRAVHLAVLAGREWVVDASESEQEAAQLFESSEGLLSPERQAHIELVLAELRGFRTAGSKCDKDTFAAVWNELWDQFSVSDLFWLGRLRKSAPAGSLAFRALSHVPARAFDGATHNLAAIQLEHARSSRGRLAPMAPYEDYAAQMMPARLAERLSELPLALACAIDEAGLPAMALGLTAEPLARRLFESLSMADMTDFRPVLAMWRKVDGALVQALYEEELGKIP